MDILSVLSILCGIMIGIYFGKKQTDAYKRKCDQINGKNRKL